MNIITFDIEEWYLEKAFHGGRGEKYAEFDRQLDNILNMLDEQHFKATFFVVGKMALEFPAVVQRIFERGHEIGCHSNVHTWLNKMSREQALNDTRQAVDALEQCIGRKVKSYRAPAFSIGENNIWAFEILARCGIERDSSVFPAARDFGGFPNFGTQEPTLISVADVKIKEFPMSKTQIFGKDIIYSGGGYFRFFPLWFVKRQVSQSQYNMCYFHIHDLLQETSGLMSKADYEQYFKESGTLLNRYKRYFKSNFGKKTAWEKLRKLVKSYQFVNLDNADNLVDWNQAKTMVLN